MISINLTTWCFRVKKLALATLLIISSTQSYADCQYSKKIILPTWFTANTAEYVYNVVNTSSSPIQVKITLINADGNEYTVKWWKDKAIKRYTTLYNDGRIKPEVLFYVNAIGMTWEQMKDNYLKEVGR